MDPVESSEKSQPDDTNILEILLNLSSTPPGPWKAPFPYLDSNTVSRASQSIAAIFSQDRSRLRKQITYFTRKLCSGSGTYLQSKHALWISRALSPAQAVSCLLDVCSLLIKDNIDWVQRHPEQQLAVSYALLNAAMHKPAPLHPEAGLMCVQIVERLLNTKRLTRCHHNFLAQVWEFAAELPIDFRILMLLCERSSLGLERLLLWLGKTAVGDDKYRMGDALETSLVTILIRACSQSSNVFQNVSSILSHMMVVSEAHCGVQELIKSFISRVETECIREGCDVSALYEEPYVAALLCIDPSFLPAQGEDTLSQQYILELLLHLPKETSACLLSHHPLWLPVTVGHSLNIECSEIVVI